MTADRLVAALRSLEKPRTLAGATVLAVSAALWWALAAWFAHPPHHGGAEIWATAGMWVLMMAAMMLPVAAPMAAAFAEVSAREAGSSPGGRVAVFGAAYLVVWSGYAAAAGGLQAIARPHAEGVSDPVAAGAVFLAAGLYQWLPVKNACLRHCRSPVAFLLAHWRPGVAGAACLGFRHGLYCLGCCAALMALMFVFGAMNVLAMVALAAYCVAERVLPGAERWGRTVGAMLCAAGLFLLSRAG